MTKLNFEQFVNLKILLGIEGIGPGKIRNLLAHLKSVKQILNSSYEILIGAEGIDKILAQRIVNAKKHLNDIKRTTEQELYNLEKCNARILTIWDDQYPELLKKIYDPPLILYYKGNISEFDKYSIAIVGTRNPTNYGKSQAEKISSELAEQNITVVSGMARGIDSITHRAVLKKNARTIAVIGTGINIVYPPENRKLADEISEKGLIFSEYEFNTKPDAPNFPKRNRIISGLSLGTLIVETAISGGAMQTAEFALDQNREVFAIPGNNGIKQSEGTNYLIQKGNAKLVTSHEDILVELQIKLKPAINKNIPKPSVDLNIFEEKLISILLSEPVQIDKIAELSRFSTSDCLVHLLSLEFKGLVRQFPGKMFALI